MWRPRKLFWKLFWGTSLLAALVLAVCAALILKKVSDLHKADVARQLATHAELIRVLVADRFDRDHSVELDRLAKESVARAEHPLRVTLILPNGVVLADSEADPAKMEPHGDRPEVRQALAEGHGYDARPSGTLFQEMTYAAVRVGPADSPRGVVRVAMPARTLMQRYADLRELIAGIALLTLVAGLVLASVLSALWARPIRRVTAVARNLSRGDLTAQAKISGRDEVADLAKSLDTMRARSLEQFALIDRQRRMLDIVVHALHEGVIVADDTGRVLLINPAAIQLLQIAPDVPPSPEELCGRPLEQCVASYKLQQLLSHGRGVREERITVNDMNEPTLLQVRVADIDLPATRAEGEAEGRSTQHRARLAVLTDITALEHVVQVKTDFAANASHELRTPLAAICAAVETLLNAKVADENEATRRFLEVIDRQAKRMQQMVADLLDLSRVESGQVRFEAEPVDLGDILADIKTRFQERLETNRLTCRLEVEDSCRRLRLNPYLLRTVLNNLVDNAIKFTDAGGEVSIAAGSAGDTAGTDVSVAITVADTGCGIPADAQERVFERFYQVDKSRGGQATGTGLGLAIVRHAVTAMNGSVKLESRPAQGTRVTVLLPRNP